MPALVKQPYVSNINDYRDRIQFVLESYLNPYNNVVEEVSTSWEHIHEELMGDPNFGLLYTNKGFTNRIWKILEPQVSGLSSMDEKIKFLHEHLNSEIGWNKKLTKWGSENLSRIYKDKVADSGTLNLLFFGTFKKGRNERF